MKKNKDAVNCYRGDVILSSGNVQTVVKRLAKHFSHKVSVDTNQHSVDIHFLEGLCSVVCLDNSIIFTIYALSFDDFVSVRDTLDRHFVLFSKSEEHINWSNTN